MRRVFAAMEAPNMLNGAARSYPFWKDSGLPLTFKDIFPELSNSVSPPAEPGVYSGEIIACGVPLIAAHVRSMEELLADHPFWLFEPEDESDLARAIGDRLNDRATEYGRIPSWADLGEELETLILKLLNEKTSSL